MNERRGQPLGGADSATLPGPADRLRAFFAIVAVLNAFLAAASFAPAGALRRTSYDRGANSYVRRPVDALEFQEAVRALGTYWLLVNEPPPQVPH